MRRIPPRRRISILKNQRTSCQENTPYRHLTIAPHLQLHALIKCCPENGLGAVFCLLTQPLISSKIKAFAVDAQMESEIQFLTLSNHAFLSFGAGNTATIYLDSLSDASYLDWDDRYGTSKIDQLFEKYTELSSEGEFLRGAIAYTDPVTGDRKGFAYEVNEFNWKDSTFSWLEEKPQIKVSILGIINDEGPESLDEIVGDDFQEMHNTFIRSDNTLARSLGGVDVELYFDTLTVEEFQRENPGDAFLTEFGRNNESVEISVISSNAFIAPEGDIPSGDSQSSSQFAQNFDNYRPDPINYKWSQSSGPAEASLEINIQPVLDGYFKMPDSSYGWLTTTTTLPITPVTGIISRIASKAYKITDDLSRLKQISIDADLDFEVAATLGFKTGANDKGLIKVLEEKDINLGGITFPLGVFMGDLGANADFSASVGLSGLESDYQLHATQTIGVSLDNTAAPDDYKTDWKIGDFNLEKPEFNVKLQPTFQAQLTPRVELKIGYLVPRASPFFAGDSALTLNGAFNVPITLDAKLKGFPKGIDGKLSIDGNLSANVTAFEFIHDGYKYEIGSTELFHKERDLFV